MAYKSLLKELSVDGHTYKYYDIAAIDPVRYIVQPYNLPFYRIKKILEIFIEKLPISIRYLLESAVRNCDEFSIYKKDVETILDWQNTQKEVAEIPFKPTRVLSQDFTGIPAVVDLAAMRDAVKQLNGDPGKINPVCPVDLVIDHSVQVDFFGSSEALLKNQQKEFQRNRERFQFLKWGANAFKRLLIIPPGSGICHQINLEYLARLVFADENDLVYPDSVVGTDSHTTMNNGSGVLAWGVGGIEAEAVMLGQAITMVIPEVIGYRLIGKLPQHVTSTDLVLAVTKNLRDVGVVGKFVEFFGSGVTELSIADRATIANMCPEYGATIGFFPPDARTLTYYKNTGREEHVVRRAAEYLKKVQLFVDHNSEHMERVYTKVFELDLSQVVPCISGPKRPQDRIELTSLQANFRNSLASPLSFTGFGISPQSVQKTVPVVIDGNQYTLKHGSIVISAITSCTNTSNPSVMLGAGLLAKKAVEFGLTVPKYVKTSLSPGSHVVSRYLKESALLPYLEQLGYYVAGFGCMTCIGNSGPLHKEVIKAIENNDLVVAGILSGNRNFEGRIHPNVKANYLASPVLVVAFGIAGRIDIDFEKEPLGVISKDGAKKEVFLRDIWPSRDEVAEIEEKVVLPNFFKEVYGNIEQGSEEWRKIVCSHEQLYHWDQNSTYIRKVNFFDGMGQTLPPIGSIRSAYVLVVLGDSVTTDHISPAGGISKVSPAAKYLAERGVDPADFNTYGSRRGNHEVMARGTYANIRLLNKMASKPGPYAVHIPTGVEMSVFEVAERYCEEKRTTIVIAGKEYGCGSSRDWAAKGPYLLGVRAVIAESFERIHRSNLIGMGIIPLEFMRGQNFTTLELTGKEEYTIEIPQNLTPRCLIKVETNDGKIFTVLCRLDTEIEVTYYKNGGILPYMVRKLISG
ncbi:unnamed protein product [Enterobius vermicularis]|uniref:Cytoplasmic aconitate hydratase n=1 Tax=Enterobius vermicularis TaxID=51028 RepID=A0A0N4VED8_ENTVE|nr:unnamed protein product [Enterobius vermicularis]